jgi:hypothetical protein
MSKIDALQMAQVYTEELSALRAWLRALIFVGIKATTLQPWRDSISGPTAPVSMVATCRFSGLIVLAVAMIRDKIMIYVFVVCNCDHTWNSMYGNADNLSIKIRQFKKLFFKDTTLYVSWRDLILRPKTPVA